MTPKNIPIRGTDDQAGGVRPMEQRHGVVHGDHGWSNTRHAWRCHAAAVGIISSWNPGAEKLFGCTAAEAIGQPLLLLIPPEHAREEAQLLARFPMGRTGLIPLPRKNHDQRIHGRQNPAAEPA